MESWAEKYRPESLSDIIGNTKVINDLKTWAGSWGGKMVKKGSRDWPSNDGYQSKFSRKRRFWGKTRDCRIDYFNGQF